MKKLKERESVGGWDCFLLHLRMGGDGQDPTHFSLLQFYYFSRGSVAKFIDPDWGCPTSPPVYLGGRAGTTALCRS